MTNEDYVRQSADKYGWKKYYSTLRPVSMETQPKDGFMDFVNYDDRTEVDGKMCGLSCITIESLLKKK